MNIFYVGEFGDTVLTQALPGAIINRLRELNHNVITTESSAGLGYLELLSEKVKDSDLVMMEISDESLDKGAALIEAIATGRRCVCLRHKRLSGYDLPKLCKEVSLVETVEYTGPTLDVVLEKTLGEIVMNQKEGRIRNERD